MKDFQDFLLKNNITPENTPGSEHALLRKAFLAGMKSQKNRMERLVAKVSALETTIEDCIERVRHMNLLFAAIEEEQEK